MSAETLRRAAAQMRERAEAASPSPWFDNSYSAIISGPQVKVHDGFWTDERLEDGHSYDHRVGATCPACGERPAVSEKTGRRFGTYWDCAHHKEAYDAEPVVATVPAQYGDTATGHHRADAEHIASWHPAVALAVADWLESEAAYVEDGNWAVTFEGKPMFPARSQALAVATAYLNEGGES